LPKASGGATVVALFADSGTSTKKHRCLDLKISNQSPANATEENFAQQSEGCESKKNFSCLALLFRPLFFRYSPVAEKRVSICIYQISFSG